MFSHARLEIWSPIGYVTFTMKDLNEAKRLEELLEKIGRTVVLVEVYI